MFFRQRRKTQIVRKAAPTTAKQGKRMSSSANNRTRRFDVDASGLSLTDYLNHDERQSTVAVSRLPMGLSNNNNGPSDPSSTASVLVRLPHEALRANHDVSSNRSRTVTSDAVVSDSSGVPTLIRSFAEQQPFNNTSSSSLTRVPVTLRKMGVSSNFDPSAAIHPAPSSSLLGLNATPFDYSAAPPANVPPFAETASSVTTTASGRQLGAAPHPNGTPASVESRAQVFLSKLELAAKRELEHGVIKTQTRNGCILERDKSVLGFQKVELREKGVATRRFQTVQHTLADDMVQLAAPTAQALMAQSGGKLGYVAAHHAALYGMSAAPATTLAANPNGLVNSHVNVEEHNPYFPVNPRLPPPPARVHAAQPLVVVSPSTNRHTLAGNLLSPRKGDVGVLTIAAPPPPAAPLQLLNSSYPARTTDAGLLPHHHVASEVVSIAAPSDGNHDNNIKDDMVTPSFSHEEKTALLHVCRFVAEQPIGIGSAGVYFSRPSEFVDAIGVSVRDAARQVTVMSQNVDSWDMLEHNSPEWLVVRNLVKVAVSTSRWYVSALAAPHGAPGGNIASCVRVKELYRKLNTASRLNHYSDEAV